MKTNWISVPQKLVSLILISTILHCPVDKVDGQDGEPFMNHFKLENVPGNRITSIGEDLENSMVFSGNTGVITFDSEDWQIHSVPNIPMAVATDSTFPLIYVGGRGFYGYLLKTGTGSYEYHDLTGENENPGDIYKIYQTSRHVIFYGDKLIALADRHELYNLSRFRPDSTRIFSGLLIFRDNAYVNLLGKGIYELNDGGLIQVETRINFSSSEILFGVEYNDSNALVGLDNNTIYWFNGDNFYLVELEDQEYLEQSFLEDAEWLENNVFALSTILGGCMIVDVVTGKTVNILNYQTGLPDDEIYAIGKDNNHGLWLSHQYGLTRVDVRLPIRSYENYPGLEGNLTAVAILDSTIYVSTNEGIFYLEEKKDYLEEEIVVKVKAPPLPPPVELEPEVEETTAEDVEEETTEEKQLSPRELRKAKREARKAAMLEQEEEPAAEETPSAVTDETGVEKVEETEEKETVQEQKPRGLKSLFQRKTERTKDIEVDEETAQTPVSRIRYIKQKIYSLQSISHEFTRLGDFEEKAKDLIPVGDRILISTNEGLYELVDKELKIIRNGWYVEGIFPTRDPGRIYVVTDETAYQLLLEDGEWRTARDFSYVGEEIYSVCEEKDSTIWLGCDNRSYRIRPLNNAITDIESFDFHENYYDPVTMRNVQDTVYFFLSSGIYIQAGDSIYPIELPEEKSLSRIHLSTCAIAWVQTGDQWISYRNQENYNEKIDTYLNLFEDIADLFLDPQGNVWVISENSYLHKINHDKVDSYKPDFELYLKSVYNDDENYLLDQLHFDYYDRSLVFNLSAPFYLKDNSTSYQFFAEGMSEGWSDWNQSGELGFPVLPMGKFTLHVRARNVLGQVTDVKSYPIVIRPPWWLRWPFLVAAGIVLVAMVIGLIRWRLQKLIRDKAILEEKVRQRTAEIQRQKDEISEQKKEIMDSIHYAQRIQKAVLPSDLKVEQELPEHFILYLPRDIVSGDFYWLTTIDTKIIFVAADCTGHGVPGAFMSMLGISFLNEIVSNNKKLSAARMLNDLRASVKETLSQSEEGESKDGMDIALCIFDQTKMTLQYAGAYNPLCLIRNGELTEYKADRMPIGIHGGEESDFKNHNIKVQSGDCIYIFSDGFQDQIGGEQGKKFLSKSLKLMLTEIHYQPMKKQKEIMYETLQKWMKGFQQVDDIIVLGMRV
ncbi:SpoIIE family protein phosphatase [Bacteroidota bacterium]